MSFPREFDDNYVRLLNVFIAAYVEEFELSLETPTTAQYDKLKPVFDKLWDAFYGI